MLRPVAFKNNGKKNDVDFDLTEDTYRTWQKLEEMVEKGKVRNIGLSKWVTIKWVNDVDNKSDCLSAST